MTVKIFITNSTEEGFLFFRLRKPLFAIVALSAHPWTTTMSS